MTTELRRFAFFPEPHPLIGAALVCRCRLAAGMGSVGAIGRQHRTGAASEPISLQTDDRKPSVIRTMLVCNSLGSA
jgi:hypothetical protein